MARRSPRWQPPVPKVLATTASRRVIECYAIEGKAYFHHPNFMERCTIVLVNRARDVVTVVQNESLGSWYDSDEVPPGEWWVLGWVPAGDLRHGPLERVDPELADLDALPRPNAVQERW